MKITILGLWHLGSVTAACMARHHHVLGLDFEETLITNLNAGKAPLHEPGLDELLRTGLDSKRLSFTNDVSEAKESEVLWVCYDTPVDSNDQSDLEWVFTRLNRVLPTMKPRTVVLLSSQLPVGTCARFAEQYSELNFACSPENLRLGKAIEAFEHPARIIVGSPSGARPRLEAMLSPLNAPLVWMRSESAEMVKHALNSFLALSVAYINEIASLSETVGADAQEVATGLKSDPRIGPRAYLGPGGPFAGGTLARDVVSLSQLGKSKNLPLSLIPAIKESNDHHRNWAFRKIKASLPPVDQPIVAVLGLAYTPNTNTLRRSAAVELCRQLLAEKIEVRAFDPLIKTVDEEHQDIPLVSSPHEALTGAHLVVICTEWPIFRGYDWAELCKTMNRSVMIDANRYLEKTVAEISNLRYLAVGQP